MDNDKILKPCPFCGSENLHIADATYGVVICKDCGAQGGLSYEVSSTSAKRADAIRKWNTRGKKDDRF